jgi:predicted phage terminase large subunit-like protein
MLSDATMRAFLAVAETLGILKSVKQNPPAVHLKTGAEIIFRSADDPTRMYGPNLSGIWLDEASLMPIEAFNVGIGRLREGGEQGFLTATFTPKGIGHWTHDVFATGRPNTAIYFAKTTDNPFLPKMFAANVRGQYTSRLAQQELEGQFLAGVENALFQRSWFRIVEVVPTFTKVVRAWDCASTPKDESSSYDPDYTCGLKMGKTEQGDWYILDVKRFRGSPSQVQRTVRATAEADGKQVEIVMEREPGSAGVTVVDFFLRLLSGWNFHGVRSTGSKADRATPLAAQAEGGKVFILRGPYLEDVLLEMELFPFSGRHDDIVDSASLAFSRLAEGQDFWLRIGTGASTKPDLDTGEQEIKDEYDPAYGHSVTIRPKKNKIPLDPNRPWPGAFGPKLDPTGPGDWGRLI